jgi:methionyl-tRNA formyltransferase
MQHVPKPKKIAVVSKYDIYFKPIISRFKSSQHLLDTFHESEDFYSEIISSDYDYIFFPHVSKIISSELISKFHCIGFHTGNLPSDRGGSPIQHKILKGEYQTKVSAFTMTQQIDAGAIHCQKDLNIEFGNVQEIITQISILISDMIFEIVNFQPESIPQSGVGSINKRLTPIDSALNIDELNLKKIYDRIRMLDGFEYPKAYIETTKYKISFSNASYKNDRINADISIEMKQK